MKGIPRLAVFGVFACLATVAVGCGGGGHKQLTVRSEFVTGTTTSELRVLAPEGEGPWPVVLTLHGLGGTGQDMV